MASEYQLLSPDDQLLYRPEQVAECGWTDLITANPPPANKDENVATARAFTIARGCLRDLPHILQQGDVCATSAHRLVRLLARDLRKAW